MRLYYNSESTHKLNISIREENGSICGHSDFVYISLMAT